jgi:hypothetical protein
VLQRFSESSRKAFTRLLQDFYKVFTRLLRGFHRVFINILQGAHKAVYKDCTRFLIVFSCFVQSCYIMFSNAVARLLHVVYNLFTWSLQGLWQSCLQGLLQGVYKVFYKKCLQCFYNVFKGFLQCVSQLNLQGVHKAFARF